MHTANPDEGGAQNTSEASYTGYARVALARDDASAFTVTGNAVTNAALIQFGLCTAGSSTVTHWAIGYMSSGEEDTGLTADAIAQAVWDSVVPASYGEGTAGALMGKLLTTAKYLGLK